MQGHRKGPFHNCYKCDPVAMVTTRVKPRGRFYACKHTRTHARVFVDIRAGIPVNMVVVVWLLIRWCIKTVVGLSDYSQIQFKGGLYSQHLWARLMFPANDTDFFSDVIVAAPIGVEHYKFRLTLLPGIFWNIPRCKVFFNFITRKITGISKGEVETFLRTNKDF
jgi:hypothetical protein